MSVKTGMCIKVVRVGESDLLYLYNGKIKRAGGIVVKAASCPRTTSDGAYWFTGILLKNYPTIPNRRNGRKEGLVLGEEIKFLCAYIQKSTRAERRKK